MWFEKRPQLQFFEVKKAEGEVRGTIVVNWCVTAFDEASAVVWDVPWVRCFTVAWVVLNGSF